LYRFHCNSCYSIYDEPKKIKGNLGDDPWGTGPSTYVEEICPVCESNDIEYRKICPDCECEPIPESEDCCECCKSERRDLTD